MEGIESNKNKLIAIVLFLIAGISLMYLGYSKKENISNYNLDDTAITVIDLTEKNSSLNILPLVIGTGMILIAMFLIGQVYSSNPRTKSNKKDKLTGQEKKIVEFIQNGKTNKEIAIELSISPSTVKTHINNIYKKLEVNSREQMLQVC